MVSGSHEAGHGHVMSDDTVGVCAEFTQHAWKQGVCCNCQRPRDEHTNTGTKSPKESSPTGSGGNSSSTSETTSAKIDSTTSKSGLKSTILTVGSGPGSANIGVSSGNSSEVGADSPRPAKRNSVMTKSWMSSDGGKSEGESEDQWNSMCLPDPDHPNKRLDEADQKLVSSAAKRKASVDNDQKLTSVAASSTARKASADTDSTTRKASINTDSNQRYFPEHCYEDIDAEELKSSKKLTQSVKKDTKSDTKNGAKSDPKSCDSTNSTSSKSASIHDYVNTKENSAIISPSATTTVISINPEDRLKSLIHDKGSHGNRGGNPHARGGNSRSRSSSRERSPVPAPKPPKLSDKPLSTATGASSRRNNCKNDTQTSSSMQSNKGSENQKGSDSKNSEMESSRSRKKLKKGGRSISFVEDDPSVIGDDGGLDNLYSDHEDEAAGDGGAKELLEFTEDEKEWAMQALKNTIWNTEHIGAGETGGGAGGKGSGGAGGGNVKGGTIGASQSREFEDLKKVEGLFTGDRFANVRDCEPLPESQQSYGTFPLKKKNEKTAMDNMFSGNRLSALSETGENAALSDVEDKYESVLKFLGADKIDLLKSSSPKHNMNIVDGDSEAYDDPWTDEFKLDSKSEMNLFDEIKSEIDLDSSSAGFALVDLLNNVLAGYSTGTPSETDSVKNLDQFDEKGEGGERREKSSELEAKMVTLAANLRKQRAKGRAPRPPSCPPEPPGAGGSGGAGTQDGSGATKSPAKQAELRAAQSKEPTFKMVPLGKNIGPNVIQAAQSQVTAATSNSKTDVSNTSTSSSNSSENMDGYKVKGEKDKNKQKGGGGIGGFFSRIFGGSGGRGKETENDFTGSTDTVVSNTWSLSDPYSEVDISSGNVAGGGGGSSGNIDPERESLNSAQGDSNNSGKDNNRKSGKKVEKSSSTGSSKMSPRMKMKVLPTTTTVSAPNRPVSPRPVEKPPAQPGVGVGEAGVGKGGKTDSPKPESRTRDKDNVKAEKSDKNASQKNSSNLKSSTDGSGQGLGQSNMQLSPSRGEGREHGKATSPKSKEAPPLPMNPPRDVTDSAGVAVPRPRARGNSDGGIQGVGAPVAPRSRPRTRESIEGKPRDTPNVPPPKPPVAMKPKAPAVQTKSLDLNERNLSSGGSGSVPVSNERLTSTSSFDDVLAAEDGQGQQKRSEAQRGTTDPKVLRKRAKSPKRFAAPIAPGRTSLPNVLTDSNVSLTSNSSEVSVQSLPANAAQSEHKTENKNLAFAKELEKKLHKDSGGVTQKPDNSEKCKSLPADKNSKGSSVTDKTKSLPPEAKNAASKVKDVPIATSSPKGSRSNSASKDDVSKTSPPTIAEDKERSKTLPSASSSLQSSSSSTTDPEPSIQNTSTATPSSEITIPAEKIELPKSAGNSRKSFLGKLKNKNKPPPPPSVKRTKSITESSVLADHHLKKIDVKDISAPVLITDLTCSKVVNRRNTISIGDDNSFLSGGSTSSGSTSAGEKCDLSPHGSVENLYEFIKSDAPTPPDHGPDVGADKKNLYDPVVESNVVGLRPPSMTGSEGYLEPVRSNQLLQSVGGEPIIPVGGNKMADSMISLGSMTTSDNMGGGVPSNENSIENPYGVNDGLDDLDDLTAERRQLLANQPIYEEITNGYGRLGSGGVSDVGHGGGGVAVGDHGLDGNHGNEEFEEVYGVVDEGQNAGGSANANNSNSNPLLLPSVMNSSVIKKKDSFSSDSEISSSASNSLSRPRPIPRKRPRQIGSGFEQYVAMNRPSVAVSLKEDQLREMLSKLTAMNLNTIKEIYTQHEKCFTKENLHLGSVGPLKWQDFNIYGKALHTSEKCVIYNAKMRNTMSPCQLMLLHSRPEITSANHPSLLKPTCIFTDSVPFTYLTDEFIKTSQILETCVVNQSNSNMAKCYIVVGLFDITESINHHMNALERVSENQVEFLRKVLFFVLQLLSAISHCLEQGHPLSEADFHDLYLISNPYCLGETVSFLPQVRSPDDQRIDRVCLFLEQFLQDMCAKCDAKSVLDDAAFFIYTGIQKVTELLESGVVECLPIVRSYAEFLLWGPVSNTEDAEWDFTDDRQSDLEPRLSMWLEKQRAELIHDFAKRIQHGARCNIKDFYMMKFLLKASSGSLLECIRCHAAATAGSN